jgi:hypothetical protein
LPPSIQYLCVRALNDIESARHQLSSSSARRRIVPWIERPRLFGVDRNHSPRRILLRWLESESTVAEKVNHLHGDFIRLHDKGMLIRCHEKIRHAFELRTLERDDAVVFFGDENGADRIHGTRARDDAEFDGRSLEDVSASIAVIASKV